MLRCQLVVAALIAATSSAAADGAPQEHAGPPRILIASGIDRDGNLIVSATDARAGQRKVEVEVDGKREFREEIFIYHVLVLNRHLVSLKAAAISDRDGATISLAQARARLTKPTPILFIFPDEKVDPIYSSIITKDTLKFTFKSFPEFKDLPSKNDVGK
jgi:hypothetical protein